MVWFLALLWLTCELTSANDEYCPYRWQPWEGKCLYMDTASVTPNKARQICKDNGGSPVVIETVEQNDYLTDKVQLGSNEVLSLGCGNIDGNGVWECLGKQADSWFWYNESSNMGYWNWAEDQPDNGVNESRCLLLHSDGQWLDELCNVKQDLVVGCVHELLSTPIRCPLSWEPLDNKCALIIPDYKTKPNEVRQLCNSQGGNLLVVDTEYQNQYLTTKLINTSESDYMMLGCTDNENEGTWLCDDRSPYLVHRQNDTEAGYWNWSDGEPFHNDSDSFNCLFLSVTGGWNTWRCGNTLQMAIACENIPTTVECATDYEPWEDRCLHVRSFRGTADTARQACQTMDGGNLAVLESEGQSFFLRLQVQNFDTNRVGLGCDDIDDDGTWTCDGKNPEEFYWTSDSDNAGYWNWREGEPEDNPTKKCLGMQKNGNFVAAPCEIESDILLACTHTATNVPVTTTSVMPGTTNLDSTTDNKINTTGIITRDTTMPKTTLPSTTKGGPEPAPQSGLKPGAIVGIVICVLLLVSIVCFFGYVYTHPSSKAGRCFSQIGRNNGDAVSIKFQKTVSEAHLISS